MDWKKTETIFIIAFLILDIFLLVLFIDSRMASSPTPLVSQTLDEKLKSENITYGKIPSNPETGSYLSTEPIAFSQSDIDTLKGQKINLQNGNQRIFSFLTKPVKIDPEKYGADLAPLLKSDIFKGDKYIYWSYDKDKYEMTFNQKIDSRPVLFNTDGQIVFHLNKNNEVVSYTQTMLGDTQLFDNQDDVISGTDALEVLHQHGDLKQNSKILNTTLGYYNLVSLPSSDVYLPVWAFEVKHDKKTTFLLVNGLEGSVINTNDVQTNQVPTVGNE
ncbi:hypothetical protein PWEIH_10173 [Listeria weihenstephanensis FSL R9-0317]|uniref:Regulatory protein YycH-like domain-containing protein n=1 Tax=Listeria weihenstephanensis TaxID=1006155 RepID=A0A1S7FXF1_9LIST|nr:two-component system regulatory protein YycI [Listeria weihenstephanensis]AQY52126.1 hypothetical protein UE46_14600 [Listeria weihenstephanensis]EUJ37663.1 hypothetical protein PWEIH_10173 [Listeria weihenstephanensis FSL R9-0317]